MQLDNSLSVHTRWIKSNIAEAFNILNWFAEIKPKRWRGKNHATVPIYYELIWRKYTWYISSLSFCYY